MASKSTENDQDIRSDPPTMTALTLQEMKDGVPAPSENDSIHSSSAHSDTSTVNYDQESYDLFKLRVERLCQILWPPQKSIRQALSNSKTATRMRASKFFRLIIRSQKAPLIERLQGGDYNRIVGITLPLSKGEESRNRNLILRVPRWGQGQTERIVATLDYLRRKSTIPIATTIAKDFSKENPLESPYIIQNRIPGSNLEVLWTELNHSQRCTVACEVGRVIKSLLALESPVAGHVEAYSNGMGSTEPHTIVPFDLKSAGGDQFEEPEQQASTIRGNPRESQTTLDFFKCQIGRWRAVDVARESPMVDRTVGLWDGVLKVVEEMNDLGLFIPRSHCLCHVDLHPRNIMASIRPSGCIQITGILDWDEAVIAPKFVNCEPPGWLWGFDPDDLPHDDLPTWPYERPGANEVPSTLQSQELKRIFEHHAGSEYVSLAYHEHYRMSRGLFRLAVFGLTSSENYSTAERIICDWERLRQSLMW